MAVTTVFYDRQDEDAARFMNETVAGVEEVRPRSEYDLESTRTLILVVANDFPH